MKNTGSYNNKQNLFQTNHSKNNGQITISLEDKIKFLKNIRSYPEKPNKVDIIETHMSCVFLTNDVVYKLKKPVKSDSLDYSTILKRQKNCQNEVSLNKRLAPNVYLDVIPITVDSDRKLTLYGNGEVIDWLVKMRRLPFESMLSHAIKTQTVDEADIINLTKVLTNFYIKAKQIKMSPSDYYSQFEKGILNNQQELSLPKYRLPNSLISSISSNQLNFLLKYSKCLAQRAKENRIVDAHGDLRPEHVCLLNEPVVIDCLEFSSELRILDPVDELSFLALECERLGAFSIGKLILKNYSITTNDNPPVSLIDFYKSYRSCIRAKLAIWHLNDNQILDHAKWLHRANEYLNLANKYAQ